MASGNNQNNGSARINQVDNSRAETPDYAARNGLQFKGHTGGVSTNGYAENVYDVPQSNPATMLPEGHYASPNNKPVPSGGDVNQSSMVRTKLPLSRRQSGPKPVPPPIQKKPSVTRKVSNGALETSNSFIQRKLSIGNSLSDTSSVSSPNSPPPNSPPPNSPPPNSPLPNSPLPNSPNYPCNSKGAYMWSSSVQKEGDAISPEEHVYAEPIFNEREKQTASLTGIALESKMSPPESLTRTSNSSLTRSGSRRKNSRDRHISHEEKSKSGSSNIDFSGLSRNGRAFLSIIFDHNKISKIHERIMNLYEDICNELKEDRQFFNAKKSKSIINVALDVTVLKSVDIFIHLLNNMKTLISKRIGLYEGKDKDNYTSMLLFIDCLNFYMHLNAFVDIRNVFQDSKFVLDCGMLDIGKKFIDKVFTTKSPLYGNNGLTIVLAKVKDFLMKNLRYSVNYNELDEFLQSIDISTIIEYVDCIVDIEKKEFRHLTNQYSITDGVSDVYIFLKEMEKYGEYKRKYSEYKKKVKGLDDIKGCASTEIENLRTFFINASILRSMTYIQENPKEIEDARQGLLDKPNEYVKKPPAKARRHASEPSPETLRKARDGTDNSSPNSRSNNEGEELFYDQYGASPPILGDVNRSSRRSLTRAKSEGVITHHSQRQRFLIEASKELYVEMRSPLQEGATEEEDQPIYINRNDIIRDNPGESIYENYKLPEGGLHQASASKPIPIPSTSAAVNSADGMQNFSEGILEGQFKTDMPEAKNKSPYANVFLKSAYANTQIFPIDLPEEEHTASTGYRGTDL